MMEIFIVLSRDTADFIFATTDYDLACSKRREQEIHEEFAGGRPSVYIKPTKLLS